MLLLACLQIGSVQLAAIAPRCADAMSTDKHSGRTRDFLPRCLAEFSYIL